MLANIAAPKLIHINANSNRGSARPRRSPPSNLARNDLGQCSGRLSFQYEKMWEHVATAPFDRDLELAVIDDDGLHALVFPCRRIQSGWIKVETKERLDVRPTHWREWQGAVQSLSNPRRSNQGAG